MPTRPHALAPMFLGRVTDAAAAPAHQWTEVWLDATGTLVDKKGGEYGGASNLGYTIDGSTLAVDTICLVRSAECAAGTIFELIALSAGAPVLTHDQKVLTTGFSIASTSSLTAVAAALTIPANGAYWIYGRITGQLVASFASGECARIRGGVSTNGGVTVDDISITNIVTTSTNNALSMGTGHIGYVQSGMTAGQTIRLYAQRLSTDGSATFSTAQIIANSDGASHIGYMKIG